MVSTNVLSLYLQTGRLKLIDCEHKLFSIDNHHFDRRRAQGIQLFSKGAFPEFHRIIVGEDMFVRICMTCSRHKWGFRQNCFVTDTHEWHPHK